MGGHPMILEFPNAEAVAEHRDKDKEAFEVKYIVFHDCELERNEHGI